MTLYELLVQAMTFTVVYSALDNSTVTSGFRPMHSTLTALIDISWDNWYIDDGLTNAILFIDLKKCFYTIDHEILLSKL